MPIAAIEALIEVLGQSQVATVAETIDLVETQSAKLQCAVTNSIALSHGTHLFRQYLVMSLKQPGPEGKETSTQKNFDIVRQHLLRNGRLFAQRAKNARERIAVNGRRHIHDGETILTYGGSRVVGTLLGRAAEKHDFGHFVDDPIRFKVIYAIDPALETESNKVIAALRAKGVPVATIPATAVSYAMSKVDMVIVGADAVTANGGIIARLGTFQIAQLAKENKKQFVVAAEQHKFGKTFPCGQFDYGFDQGVIDFRAGSTSTSYNKIPKETLAKPIDYTKPDYVNMFIADHKVLTPSEVAKEVIDMLL
ncbi:initiation factor 2 subunit family protein [Pseudomassariella vexata]|uniref:Translation initiation factor eIF2B subunit alpha n=1 Tax=Pseudomassariella vexata TaxID=1141098 RepID=A0A1Y2DV32_9PEZI|nr:initiation factor 2 subunit family protein [Pseudomassariella vexata]ORY63131.1 initiation factor 2 subunit family protein [Pseudomassariella vexata]